MLACTPAQTLNPIRSRRGSPRFSLFGKCSKDRSGEMMPEESPWHRLVSQGGGAYRSPGYFDGKARLVAVRPLSGYPLVINVGVSESAALASWRNHALTIGIGTLLVIICTAARF